MVSTLAITLPSGELEEIRDRLYINTFLSSPHRDQNFGINELAAVQDVRNDFSLQDLDSASEATSSPQSASTFKEKGRNRQSPTESLSLSLTL